MSDHRYLLGLIRRAVEDCLDTDEPCGAVLSGGLDSSSVVALAGDIPVFTGYYDAEGFDERRYARLVGTGKHHEILITPQDFVDNFDAMAAALRPPFQGMGSFGQYMVGKYIAEQTDVRVVLSGEGSDELFGGYARLMAVAGVAMPRGYEDYRIPEGYPRTIREALDYDFAQLPNLLAVDDQCMAAHGLAAVAPFTDERIVAFAHGLNPYERVGKKFLRDTVRGIVPDAIIDRTDKMGFPIPLAQWAQTNPVRDFIGDRIGYVPDPDKPWDRGWWYDILERATREPVAA